MISLLEMGKDKIDFQSFADIVWKYMSITELTPTIVRKEDLHPSTRQVQLPPQTEDSACVELHRCGQSAQG